MNPFEMVVLIVAIVVAGRVIATKYGSHATPAGGLSAQEADQLRDDLQKLKDRVAVLERLATDDSAKLEREIEKLRSQP